MIVIEGTIRVRDMAAARPHMEAMITASRAERGCVDYSYAIDVMDPTIVRINERWESLETLALHAASEHLRQWRACWPKVGITDRSLRLYEADPEVL